MDSAIGTIIAAPSADIEVPIFNALFPNLVKSLWASESFPVNSLLESPSVTNSLAISFPILFLHLPAQHQVCNLKLLAAFFIGYRAVLLPFSLRHKVLRFIRRLLSLRVPVDICQETADCSRPVILPFLLFIVARGKGVELRQRQPPELFLR